MITLIELYVRIFLCDILKERKKVRGEERVRRSDERGGAETIRRTGKRERKRVRRINRGESDGVGQTGWGEKDRKRVREMNRF